MRTALPALLLLTALLPCRVGFAQDALSPELLARGEYVSKAGDCAGCHTAPLNGAPFAGGLGLTSPFGTIVSSNITPDKETGIGNYSYEDFARALREGVAPGGKGLYPAMPYPSFVKMNDEDMHALYAYMMHGVPPVKYHPPPTKVPFPFNQRWALRLWRVAFAPKKQFEPHASRDATWNRGAYLVQSLGHCGSCHSPRGMVYQEQGYDDSSAKFLAGNINDNWFALSLRGDAGSGLGRIAPNDVAAFLRTGHGAGMVAFGSMVQTVEDSLQYLSDDDVRAIAVYLKSLPATGAADGVFDPVLAQRGQLKTRAPDVPPAQGAAVYAGFCTQCHRDDGRGVAKVFPALTGNPSVISEDSTSLIRLVVEGGNSPATVHGPTRQSMPAFADRLSDVQIAQVLTYVRASWGNDARPVTANDVGSLRSSLHK
ncbi:cytochrome c [Caballeronia novacaledonica]|uniref:cytochrome c n=1 Tax=Caballeronia novacaledonica TaxID=1544861 RepID=UPI001EE2D8A0|nr:cytochrome c [Caballeronia novacaledonica]GJH12841.1 cytochrome c [Caballeronia novacaledonica]